MYDFHCDYIKNKYGINSRLVFTDFESLMYKFKTEDIYQDFSKDKGMFDFSNYSAKSMYYDDSNKLVFGKKKDETGSVAIEEFFGLKPKMYSLLVDDSSEHKKAKGVNRNAVAVISHNKYKDIWLNQKRLRHLISRIQAKIVK